MTRLENAGGGPKKLETASRMHKNQGRTYFNLENLSVQVDWGLMLNAVQTLVCEGTSFT